MGVALAAIADDTDLLALDQVQVGVAIVINTHDQSSALAAFFPGLRKFVLLWREPDKPGARYFRKTPGESPELRFRRCL
jgi:hypothetical protein